MLFSRSWRDGRVTSHSRGMPFSGIEDSAVFCGDIGRGRERVTENVTAEQTQIGWEAK